MEWDIAAGHAILRTSGGYVRNLNYNSNEIKYGKKKPTKFIIFSSRKNR